MAPGGDARHQRLVLMLWTCACCPALIGATTLPMSTPYLITVSPTFRSFKATLCPSGMSCAQRKSIVRSSSRISPVSVCPALMPSTTTTATESFGSCNTQWINAASPASNAAGGSARSSAAAGSNIAYCALLQPELVGEILEIAGIECAAPVGAAMRRVRTEFQRTVHIGGLE